MTTALVIKLLTALAVAIAAGIGVWKLYYSKEARIERLEKEIDDVEQKFRKALDDADLVAYNHWYSRWKLLSERAGRLRQ